MSVLRTLGNGIPLGADTATIHDLPFNILRKDVVVLVATAHNVIHRTGILQSELPGYGPTYRTRYVNGIKPLTMV